MFDDIDVVWACSFPKVTGWERHSWRLSDATGFISSQVKRDGVEFSKIGVECMLSILICSGWLFIKFVGNIGKSLELWSFSCSEVFHRSFNSFEYSNFLFLFLGYDNLWRSSGNCDWFRGGDDILRSRCGVSVFFSMAHSILRDDLLYV